MDSHNSAASDDDAHDPEQDAEHNAEHVDATAGDEIRAEGLILERAIGGWRGMVDSGLPTVVFITVYIVAARDLAPALIAAVVTGTVLAVY